MMIAETPLDRQFAACMHSFDKEMDIAVEWAARLACRAVGEGLVCVDLRAWAGREINPELRLPSLSAWKNALIGSAVVGYPGEFKPLIIEGDRLYLARYWHYERHLAKSLLARAGELCEEIDLRRLTADLNVLFCQNQNIENPDRQKIAASIAVLRRFCVISGGPGTGKTSTVVRILAALQSQADGALRIALAAPTGKAAGRMQDAIRAHKRILALPANIVGSIPETASTLHRLLGAKQDSVYFRHNRENPVPVDVVVVDEASMVDLALLDKLVETLPPKARLIMLGDKDQLAAVEAGAVFGDICAGWGYSPPFSELLKKITGMEPGINGHSASPLADCIALLTYSHRFGGDSGIGGLSRLVNEANESSTVMEFLLDNLNSDIAWVSRFDESDLLKRMDAGYQPYFECVARGEEGREVLAAFNRFRVLAAHREGPCSEASVNRAYEAVMRERLRVPGYERWYPGRPVILSRNDYGMKVFNGDVGVCLRVDGELRVCFLDAGGKVRSLAPARLPEHQPVYAMTVHKSQGSEYDEALVLLPETASPVLNRSLLYTAITRAKRRAEVWGGQGALFAALKRASERGSGLRERLWGLC